MQLLGQILLLTLPSAVKEPELPISELILHSKAAFLCQPQANGRQKVLAVVAGTNYGFSDVFLSGSSSREFPFSNPPTKSLVFIYDRVGKGKLSVTYGAHGIISLDPKMLSFDREGTGKDSYLSSHGIRYPASMIASTADSISTADFIAYIRKLWRKLR